MRWLPPMACIRVRSCRGKSRPWRRCRTSSQPDEGVWPRMRRRCTRDSTSRSANSQSSSTGSKKTLDDPLEPRRHWVEPHHEQISVRRPCQWLGVNRSGWYYQPVDARVENLHLMRWLDAQYTRCPLYGVLRMTAWLASSGRSGQCQAGASLVAADGVDGRVSEATPESTRSGSTAVALCTGRGED